jgi:single-strand DNA-binding protein
MVGVDGELRQDRWEQDGQNRSRVEIVAANIQLLSGGRFRRRRSGAARNIRGWGPPGKPSLGGRRRICR